MIRRFTSRKAFVAALSLAVSAAFAYSLFIALGKEHGWRSTCTERVSEVNFSQFADWCVSRVLQDELPISPRDSVTAGHDALSSQLQVAYAHHYDAGRLDLWNEEIRFEIDETLTVPGCAIWEVGANVLAQDSRRFMDIYPLCQFHAFEPIPEFYEQLTQNWSRSPGPSKLHIYGYGIGAETESFTMRRTDLAGQSTFIEESANGDVSVSIKSFEEATRDAGGSPSLISLNCEGCEWTFLKAGLDTGFLRDVNLIQIGWHNYGEHIGQRVLELCELRQRLAISHYMVKGIAFGWERWKKRDTVELNLAA